MRVFGHVGCRWKALTEDERQKYVDAAEQDKIRYETEMEIWNKPEAKQARAEAAEAAAAAAAAEKLAKKEAKKEANAEAAREIAAAKQQAASQEAPE